jgi:transcriptional regulator
MSLYVPGDFTALDKATAARLLRDHPFAALVTPSGDSEPFVTHLPLIFVADGKHGTLHGHFARANPHAGAAGQAESLAIFHGPHAYVTPSWYVDPAGAVPTWNYAVVHAYGRIELASDRGRKRHRGVDARARVARLMQRRFRELRTSSRCAAPRPPAQQSRSTDKSRISSGF